MHLFHIARKINAQTHLIDRPESVETIAIPAGATVFIASGASTPEELIVEVVRRLEARDDGPGQAVPRNGRTVGHALSIAIFRKQKNAS